MKTLTKEEMAEELVQFYYDEIDEDVRVICRITTTNEDDPGEPLKLLKVTEDTEPTGIMPLKLSAGRCKWQTFSL